VKLVVIGVGNILAEDDAIGVLLARSLSEIPNFSLLRVEIIEDRIPDLLPVVCLSDENTVFLIVDSAEIDTDCVLLKVTHDSTLDDTELLRTKVSHGATVLDIVKLAASMCSREVYVLLVRGERFELGRTCISSDVVVRRGVECLAKALQTVLGGNVINVEEIKLSLYRKLRNYLCSNSS